MKNLNLIAATAIAVTALVMSSVSGQAQAPGQDGPNGANGTVVVGGQVIGQDPDPGVRSNLYNDYANTQNPQ